MGMKRLKCTAAPLVLSCKALWLVIHHWILTQKDFKRSKTKPLNLQLFYSHVNFAHASASIKATCRFLEFRLLARFESRAGPVPLLRNKREDEHCKLLTKMKHPL